MSEQKDRESLKEFLNFVKNKCEENKVEFNLSKEEHLIMGGFQCSGYFDEKKPELAVATGKPFKDWIEILVHEYCHLNQFLEKSHEWTERMIGGIESSAILDLWLNKQIELNPGQLFDCVMRIITVEKDCEIRSVEVILDKKLPINTDLYIRKANAYVLGYHVIKNNRRWYNNNKSPYSIEKVTDLMPNHFKIDYMNPPDELLKVIEEECFTLR